MGDIVQLSSDNYSKYPDCDSSDERIEFSIDSKTDGKMPIKLDQWRV